MRAKRPSRADQRVARLAGRQWGVVSFDELMACGLSKDGIRRRVANGHLHPLHKRVFAVGHANPPIEGVWLAAVKACGPGAVLSHYSAAALYRLVKWDGRRPEVTTVRDPRPKGIKTHHTDGLSIADTTRCQGIPVTTPERTLRDLASILPYDELRRAVREAQALRLTTTGRLATSLDAPGPQRGRRNLARIIATGPAPTRSDLEDVVLDLLLQAGFDPPQVNLPIHVGGKRLVPDFRWPDRNLTIEADSAAWHDHRLAREDDAERQALLEAHGERVIRVTWHQAVTRRAQTIARIRAAYLHSWEHMISTNQFKNGNHIEVEGTVFKIIEFQHVKPGKGGAFVRTKLRRASDGAVIDRTFRAGEKFRPVRTEARKMQFLYADGTDAHFMDEESYDQIALPETGVAEALKWIKPNETIDLLYIDGSPSDIQLSASVELEVTHTEPGVRGDTASGGGNKPATLETGATVNVPLFVNIGDRVKVDTRSGSYMSRA
jgi:elongation factor P